MEMETWEQQQQESQPIAVRVEMRQCRQLRRHDVVVVARIGAEEIYRSKSTANDNKTSSGTGSSSSGAVWAAAGDVFGCAHYEPDRDAPLLLEVCACPGPGGALAVLGRARVPLGGKSARRCAAGQPTVWAPLVGTGADTGGDVGVGVLATPAVLDARMAHRGTDTRVVLVQDELLLFAPSSSSSSAQERYVGSVVLGPEACVLRGRAGTGEWRVVDARGAEHGFVAADARAAARWCEAVRVYAGAPLQRCFGVPLSALAQPPAPVTALAAFVRAHGLQTRDVFRTAVPETDLVDALRRIDVGAPALAPDESPHAAATLLKRFLRLLPESLLPSVPASDAPLRDTVERLPAPNRAVLACVLCVAHAVHCARQTTAMDCVRLGASLAPVLIHGPEGTSPAAAQFVSALIAAYPKLFPRATTAAPSPSPPPTLPPAALLPNTQQEQEEQEQPHEERLLPFVTSGEAAQLIPAARPVFASDEVAHAEMQRHAEIVFRKYQAGGAPFMSEAGFCAFVADLSALPAVRPLSRRQALCVFTALAPERRLDLPTFADWLANNYRALYVQ